MGGGRTDLGSVPWLPGGICLAADGGTNKKKLQLSPCWTGGFLGLENITKPQT